MGVVEQIPRKPEKRRLESVYGIRDYITLLEKVKEYKKAEEEAGRRSRVCVDWGVFAIVAMDLDEFLAYENALAETS